VAEGISVGISLGALVGPRYTDGILVGVTDGYVVVGEFEGGFVGRSDGLTLGLDEGEKDGKILG